ncbi:ABC transporter substrate-binding protein [Streptacidiphilus jiangxiensis]|uniref:Peptide/nickel transport system substrate-binding protein n=1 Tax=Streptacidiphilus jiangxiensis TaxID=235985 RepID=A0A1H7WPK7_STRJI|nr:ABC transporter substrate-binding protein [Streptacidiphilus jiangxiensis]SEM23391.1 peptide/nickel transport system substrate-binding protein [Streptacidiphilus jiangxiensis]
MLRPARIALFTAASVALTGSLAACGAGSGSSAGGSSDAFSAANCQGGTLRVLDSAKNSKGFDPAVLYTSGGGAIPRLLFRTLTTRQSVPGVDGTKVVPDLATDTGKPSENATVWTYHLKAGLKFADGTPITSADVKYGVERSFSPQLAGGPPYLRDWLVGGADYQGPYGSGNTDLASIATPDASTIVFHLRKSEGDFPYLAAETQFAPVPKAKDTGKEYNADPVSSGPYTIAGFTKGRELDLVRNPYWSRSTDQQRLACPDRIDVSLGLSPAVINQRLSSSVGQDANAITTDTSLDAPTLARVSADPALKKRVVTGKFPQIYYLAFNLKKAPFDNQLVREALSYAVDRTALVNAEGGTQLAVPSTTFTPESLTAAHQDYDDFPAGATGNPEKAKQLLAQAGHPNGITVPLAYDTDDTSTGAPAATALQQAFAKAGITLQLQPLSDADFSGTVNTPATQPALTLTSWGADWPSGGPFLTPIFDGRQIVTGGGNFNLAQYNDPAVNAQIDKINQITDYAAAQKQWAALDAQLGKLALTVPLYEEATSVLTGSHVKNAYLDQWRGWYDIATVSVK